MESYISSADLDADTSRVPAPGSGQQRLNFSSQQLDKMAARADEPMYEEGHYIEGSFESLDYELVHSASNIKHKLIIASYGSMKVQLLRVVVCLIVGVLTACCAATLCIGIDLTSDVKFGIVKRLTHHCEGWQCFVLPFLAWLGFNTLFALIAFATAYIEPVAIGSGIPQIKCYLNGVKIPRCVRLKTLFMKLLGVYASVMAGLPVGKEGPMIHSGAVIAAGLSQGKSSTLNFNTPFFQCFREDHEKRDFVACGTAAGVAAAFGAPGGGTLFAIEEGASYLHQDLLFRLLFTAFLSSFVLKQILSAFYGHPGEVLFSGLLDFGSFAPMQLGSLGYELLAYGCMAVVLGLCGAAFVKLNVSISIFRKRYLTSWWLQCGEVILVSFVMLVLGLCAIHVSGDLVYYGDSPQTFPIRCRMSVSKLGVSDLLMQTPEVTLRSLLHRPPGSFQLSSLLLLSPLYFLMTVWTYGLPVPSGVFIPSLVTGAFFGRTVAAGLLYLHPHWSWWIDPGKFALFGGAAMLGGVVRMAISLTLIILEAVGIISVGPILMAVLMIAKYTADLFNESLYDAHIELDGIPLLSWRPPPGSEHVQVTQFMSRPVRCVRVRENVGVLYDLLDSCTHNGFPVVDNDSIQPQQETDGDEDRAWLQCCDTECSDDDANCQHASLVGCHTLAASRLSLERQVRRKRVSQFGRFRGLILRSQLVEMLKYKIYTQVLASNSSMSAALLNADYPRYPSHRDVHVSHEERALTVDLNDYMNPACTVVLHTGNLPRVFELFRALGLRHCVVINDRNQVVGMVTRKDLSRYRICGPLLCWSRAGRQNCKRLYRLPIRGAFSAATADQPLSGVCRHLVAARLRARAAVNTGVTTGARDQQEQDDGDDVPV